MMTSTERLLTFRKIYKLAFLFDGFLGNILYTRGFLYKGTPL